MLSGLYNYDRLGCWKSRTINSFSKYLWYKPTNLTIESGQFLSFVKCRRINASLITSSSTLRNFPFEKLNLLECRILFVTLIATLCLVEVWTARNTQPIYLSYLMFSEMMYMHEYDLAMSRQSVLLTCNLLVASPLTLPYRRCSWLELEKKLEDNSAEKFSNGNLLNLIQIMLNNEIKCRHRQPTSYIL